MNRLILLVFTIISTTMFGQTLSVQSHTERIAEKFIIQFSYPTDIEFEKFDDEILAFGVKSNDSLIHTIWTIFIESESEWNVKLEKKLTEQTKPKNSELEIKTVLIGGNSALEFTLTDITTRKVISKKIIVEKYSSLIYIILDSDRIDDFENFVKTIKLTSIK